MLPYFPRAPAYGSKLGAIKDKNDPHPYRGGGPLQQALYDDLKELQLRFVQELETSETSGRDNDEDQAGYVFEAFKSVFRNAKVALVHSWLVPSRVDEEGYLQLAYAALFRLLRDRDAVVIKLNGRPTLHDVFCVFAVYTLHETCNRAYGPARNVDLLPIGYRQAHRPLRLSYRQPIRIDQQSYRNLLRIQMNALRYLEAQATDSATTKPMDASSSTAACVDVLAVLMRLWGRFDLCEYTGPGPSLEALVGHELWPFPESKEAALAALADSSSQPVNGHAVESSINEDRVSMALEAYIGTVHGSSTTTTERGTKRVCQTAKAVLFDVESSIGDQSQDDKMDCQTRADHGIVHPPAIDLPADLPSDISKELRNALAIICGRHSAAGAFIGATPSVGSGSTGHTGRSGSVGRQALESLLRKVGHGPQRRKTRPARQLDFLHQSTHEAKQRLPAEHDMSGLSSGESVGGDDEGSIAASGAGRTALDKLLLRVQAFDDSDNS